MALKLRYGKLTDQQSDSLGNLAESYKQLDAAGAGLATRLSAALAPSLSRIVNFTTGWIVANRELIAQSVEHKIAALSRAFDFVADAAGRVLAVPWVAEFFKGVDASDAFNVGLAFLGTTMAGPVLAAVHVLTAAVWSMNAAIWANPWVWLIGLIAGAAYAVYANWGPITAWFDEQMSAVQAAFDRGFGSGLVELLGRFEPQAVIKQAINGLVKWLFGIDLFDAGRNLMQRLIDGIKSLFPDFEKLWDPIRMALRFAIAPGSLGGDVLRLAGAQGPQASIPAGTSDITEGYRRFYADRFPESPLPSSPGAAAAYSRPRDSEVKVKVDFTNVPQGAQVSVESTGPARIERDVGYSMVNNT